MGIERLAGRLKDLVEDPAHGKDRRTGVDGGPADIDLAQLAAGTGGAVKNGHVKPVRRQFERTD